MPRQSDKPDWILSHENEGGELDKCELQECARRVWPIACAFGRKRLNNGIPTQEEDRLINEAWEHVLCAIAKMKKKGHIESIGRLELDAYLMKAFQHRLGRLIKRERTHHDLFRVTDPHSLAMLATSDDAETDLLRRLQVQEIVAKMDPWTREVWNYLLSGKSWKWIACRFDMNQAQAKMRYHYYISKIGRSLQRKNKVREVKGRRTKYAA